MGSMHRQSYGAGARRQQYDVALIRAVMQERERLRRNEVIRMLIAEGWEYDSPERRLLVEMLM